MTPIPRPLDLLVRLESTGALPALAEALGLDPKETVAFLLDALIAYRADAGAFGAQWTRLEWENHRLREEVASLRQAFAAGAQDAIRLAPGPHRALSRLPWFSLLSAVAYCWAAAKTGEKRLGERLLPELGWDGDRAGVPALLDAAKRSGFDPFNTAPPEPPPGSVIVFCACGCGMIVEGRSNKRYYNNAHKSRAGRKRSKDHGFLEKPQSRPPADTEAPTRAATRFRQTDT